MKVGVFSAILSNLPSKKPSPTSPASAARRVEVTPALAPGDAHCKPAELLASKTKLDRNYEHGEGERTGDQFTLLPRKSAAPG